MTGVFADKARNPAALERIVDPREVLAAAPELILASWSRPGWQAISTVQNGQIHELKSPLILQPGPAALTDGMRFSLPSTAFAPATPWTA